MYMTWVHFSIPCVIRGHWPTPCLKMVLPSEVRLRCLLDVKTSWHTYHSRVIFIPWLTLWLQVVLDLMVHFLISSVVGISTTLVTVSCCPILSSLLIFGWYLPTQFDTTSQVMLFQSPHFHSLYVVLLEGSSFVPYMMFYRYSTSIIGGCHNDGSLTCSRCYYPNW